MRIIGSIIAAIAAGHIIWAAAHHLTHHTGQHHVGAARQAGGTLAMVSRPWLAQY